MTRFTYTAVDQQGQTTRGTVEAADWPAALAMLAARGLVDCRQERSEELAVLTSADAVELAGYLSELARSGVPLTGALNALAQDASSPSLRAAIDDLTARLESGQPLDASLASLGARLPDHVRRLLISAARSNRLSEVLERLMERQREADDMTLRLRQAVVYPAILMALLVAWLLFVTWEVVPSFYQLFEDFQTDSPFWLGSFARFTPPVLIGSIAASALILGAVRLLGGPAIFSRLLSVIPLTGPCRAYRGLADFSGLLAEFLDQQIPLDESLELCAAGARDPALQVACTQAARQVAEGGTLSGALDGSRIFPKTLVRWTHWGENNAALPEALRSAATMFTDRFDLRLQLVRVFVPAIVFGLIAASAVFVAGSLFAGLFRLVRDLAGNGTFETPPTDLTLLAVVGAAFVLIVGTALLVVAAVLRSRGYGADVARILLRYVGWSLIAAALLGAALAVGGLWAFIGWILMVFAGIRGVWRYRQAQKHALWSALSLAADKRAPLAPMALAFADEQGGSFAITTRHLVRQLESGGNLSESIAWSPGALPPEAALAARIGSESGDLCGAMRATSGRRARRLLMPPALMWLLLFVPIGFGTMVFVQIRIAPAINLVIRDFDAPAPPLTTMVGGVLDSSLPTYAGIVLIFLVLLAWLQWRGTMAPRFPGLTRMVRWIELGPLLRILALVTRHGRPIPQALETIAQWHPSRWVRRRVRAAVRDQTLGISWQESLRRRRLLVDADLAVLSAAERNGNLPWALEQMGDSYARRADFRLKAWGEVAMPLLLGFVGILVALFVVAYFVPLVYLINNLA